MIQIKMGNSRLKLPLLIQILVNEWIGSPLPGGIAHDAAKPRPRQLEQNGPCVENMS